MNIMVTILFFSYTSVTRLNRSRGTLFGECNVGSVRRSLAVAHRVAAAARTQRVRVPAELLLLPRVQLDARLALGAAGGRLVPWRPRGRQPDGGDVRPPAGAREAADRAARRLVPLTLRTHTARRHRY